MRIDDEFDAVSFGYFHCNQNLAKSNKQLQIKTISRLGPMHEQTILTSQLHVTLGATIDLLSKTLR